jgi:hypothetical protein
MRTLPENTVDAWTAIHLANIGSNWIWLPTNRSQSSKRGSHPGDVSVGSTGRIVIIENKGIEEGDTIDFGGNALQRDFMRVAEESGLALLAEFNRPPLGWIFYGLPSPPAGVHVDARSWPSFPWWARLVCPHDAERGSLPARGQFKIKRLDQAMRCCIDHRHSATETCFHGFQSLVLGQLRWLLDGGFVGLPIDPRDPIGFIRRLAEGAHISLRETDIQGTDRSPPDEDGGFSDWLDYALSAFAQAGDHFGGFVI